MKHYIKTFESFIKESSLFVPRNVDSRFDEIKKKYIDMGYKPEDIHVGDIKIKNQVELNNKYKVIIGNFYCYENQLTNLEGCPEIVVGDFNCAYNGLTSLKGCPKIVTGNFECSSNSLTNLEGCPTEILGAFTCQFNKTPISLIGVPKIVNGDFICSDNNLTSLEGCPEIIKKHFYCNRNNIKSLDHFPKKIYGSVYFQNEPIFTKEEIRKVCDIKGGIVI